jgi:hypothetical protein
MTLTSTIVGYIHVCRSKAKIVQSHRRAARARMLGCLYF